jgi:hypothetical protein
MPPSVADVSPSVQTVRAAPGQEMTSITGEPSELRQACSATPDGEVVLAVAAGRVEYGSARHVSLGDKVSRSDLAGRRLAGPSPVYLIDKLPALQVERLGDRRQLVVPGADPLEFRCIAVTGRDGQRRLIAWQAGAEQGDARPGDECAVDGQEVGQGAFRRSGQHPR